MVMVAIGLVFVVYSLLYPSVEPDKIQITYNITLVGSLVICAIGVVLLFAFLPNNKRPVLIFATAVAGGMAVIYSAFYIGQALKLNMERDKLTRSVEIISQLDGPQITTIRHFLETAVSPQKMSPEEIYAAIDTDEKLWNSVRMVLNQMENLSLVIQRGYVDEEFLYKELAHMVPYYYESLKPFIEGASSKYNYPTMYIELEKLAHSWNADRLLSTGRKTSELY